MLALSAFCAKAHAQEIATDPQKTVKEKTSKSDQLGTKKAPTAPENQNTSSKKADTTKNMSLDPVLAVKNILSAHLQAIRNRDAHQVWSFFSNDYRDDFRSPRQLLNDIKNNKRSLYDHISFAFVETTQKDNKITEKIELTTRSGSKILAFFKLTKQDDGEWRVHHITLLETDSQAI